MLKFKFHLSDGPSDTEESLKWFISLICTTAFTNEGRGMVPDHENTDVLSSQEIVSAAQISVREINTSDLTEMVMLEEKTEMKRLC